MTRIGNTPEPGNIPPSTPSRDLIAGSGSVNSAANGRFFPLKGVDNKLNDAHKVSLQVPQRETVEKISKTVKK